MKIGLIAIFSFCSSFSHAQPVTGAALREEDFAVAEILNYSSPSSTFGRFKSKLLIIDFFGTWCVPCIKALPHLMSLQEQYKSSIHIILVSEETRDKLERFIKKQNSFSLPVVVDEEKKFIAMFQPPSYPYTVVIGTNNKILATPAQDELTNANIDKWLKEQEVLGIESVGTGNIPLLNANVAVEPDGNSLVQLSQNFVYAAKTGDDISGFLSQLQEMNMGHLTTNLQSDVEKKAFWINLYNAYTQVALRKNPGQYKSRGKFFRSKQFEVAGKTFSLDDMEHGILRRSKIKWSLGYLNKLFPGKTEKLLRVDKLDYRVHFALNCGAKSCPPIAFYNSGMINQQLDLAMNAYLKSEVRYEDTENVVKLPAIMNWFRRDFGGRKKMLEILRQVSIIPAGKNPKIKFKNYDWTLYLQNYKS